MTHLHAGMTGTTRDGSRFERALASELRKHVSYNALTGDLTWALSRVNVRAGSPCGCLRSDGRRIIRFQGRRMLSTHVIWLLMYQRMPKDGRVIDHINGLTTDERLENLQEISQSDNCRKMRKPKSNRSGHIGVSYSNVHKSWQAQMRVNGGRKCKWFKNMEDAVNQRIKWEREYIARIESSEIEC